MKDIYNIAVLRRISEKAPNVLITVVSENIF
jgi:hypothetical protein